VGLNIKNAEAEAEIRGLASDMGVGLTEAVITAVREARAKRAAEKAAADDAWMKGVMKILAEFDALPVLDPRSGQEIIDEMYDEDGLPV